MSTEFEDASGEIRLVGTLAIPGATVGDVLTVQADGTLAPEPPSGGGASSFPTVTFTAAQVAARWSVGDALAAMELTDVADPDLVFLSVILANDLDQNVDASSGGLYAYTPAAASTDVYNSGEAAASGAPKVLSPGTYVSAFTTTINGTTPGVMQAGSALYMILAGDAAPTTGSVTIGVLRFAQSP